MKSMNNADRACMALREHGILTAKQISARVPDVQPHQVPRLLSKRVNAGQIELVSLDDGTPAYRLKPIVPKIVHDGPVSSKLTSFLRVGTKYGPGAHGAPIRDTRPIFIRRDQQ